MEFSKWLNLHEGLAGSLAGMAILGLMTEGRKDMKKLQRSKATRKKKTKKEPTLFNTGDESDILDPARKARPEDEPESCPLTPLSGYSKHITAIQHFAHSSPENFAQVIMFSPLSANIGFAKHWDNFQVIMMILKHHYPDDVTAQELKNIQHSFSEKYAALAHSISGWKLNTIAYVWSNRHELKAKLDGVAAQGDDEALINELIKIPGAGPVKAGFIAQLLWGRAGCIDTHNIDIYTKAFPELEPDLRSGAWSKNPRGVKRYTDVLDKLKKRGIGTKQLWDVWVDFVENFYNHVSKHGMGAYTAMGSALDPDDPAYERLKGITVPKMGATTGGDIHDVPLVSGKYGMGASATHLPMDADQALLDFEKMYRRGEAGPAAARAIPFRKTVSGLAVDKNVGLGTEPSLLKYFAPAIAKGEIDPDHIRHIIQTRLGPGRKKAARAEIKRAAKQRAKEREKTAPSLFDDL